MSQTRVVGKFMDDEEYAAFEKVAEENGIDIYDDEAGEYGSIAILAAYWFSLGCESKKENI